MLSRLAHALKFWAALVITAILLLFAVVNRELVDISLFPLPYSLTLPLFLMAIICFGAGLMVGGLIMSVKLGRAKRHFRQEHQRVAALENEVKSLHTESYEHPR